MTRKSSNFVERHNHVALLCFVVLLGRVGQAFGASFDCKKAKTAAERLICATPALSSADEELSGLYKAAAAAKFGKALRVAQKDWIRNLRDKCTDVECMGAAYKRRALEFRAMLSVRGRTAEYVRNGGGEIQIVELSPTVIAFYLLATYGDHVGEACGDVQLVEGKGTYRTEDCQIDFAFHKGGSLVLVQNDQTLCEFGVNVSANGTFRKSKAKAILPPCITE